MNDTRHSAGLILMASAVLLALAGCGSGSEDPVGTWGSLEADAPQLLLAEDGGLRGTDGCNQLTGSWSVDSGVITFEHVAVTEKACPDADTWLSALATATIDGDTLHVRDEAGRQIGTLSR